MSRRVLSRTEGRIFERGGDPYSRHGEYLQNDFVMFVFSENSNDIVYLQTQLNDSLSQFKLSISIVLWVDLRATSLLYSVLYLCVWPAVSSSLRKGC